MAYATAIGLIGAVALPAMVAHVREHGTLMIDDNLPFDPHAYADFGPQSMPSYRALRASNHLVSAGEVVLDDIAKRNHPYHDLYEELKYTTAEYYDAWDEWHGGPGFNRWPFYVDAKKPDARHTLLATLCLNVQLGVSLSAARAVHYLIHENRHANAEELDAAIARTLPRTLRIASTDRHLGWFPEWPQALDNGQHLGNMPEDGALALLQESIDQIVSPNRYAASVGGMAVMRNRDFCPHPLVSEGAVPKAGSCAGDPWIRYSDRAKNQSAQDFFEHMGFKLAKGHFNFAAVALAMGRRLVAEAILPAMRHQTARV
jgi:hypothetical protein